VKRLRCAALVALVISQAAVSNTGSLIKFPPASNPFVVVRGPLGPCGGSIVTIESDASRPWIVTAAHCLLRFEAIFRLNDFRPFPFMVNGFRQSAFVRAQEIVVERPSLPEIHPDGNAVIHPWYWIDVWDSTKPGPRPPLLGNRRLNNRYDVAFLPVSGVALSGESKSYGHIPIATERVLSKDEVTLIGPGLPLPRPRRIGTGMRSLTSEMPVR
jgi:hypothetical protein